VHSAYAILEQRTYKQLSDLLEIHFLNLSAVHDCNIRKTTIDKQQKLIHWLQFIETDSKEVRAMLATTSPVLQMLNEQLDVLSLSPVERKLYESRMKLKSDIVTISESQFKAGIAYGMQQGKQEWLERGRAEGEARGALQKALQDARNLKRLGVSVEIISQATGFTKEDVEKLD